MTNLLILVICALVVYRFYSRLVFYSPCQHEVVSGYFRTCFHCGMTLRQMMVARNRYNIPYCRKPHYTDKPGIREQLAGCLWKIVAIHEPPGSPYEWREIEVLDESEPQWKQDIFAEMMRRREGRTV